MSVFSAVVYQVSLRPPQHELQVEMTLARSGGAGEGEAGASPAAPAGLSSKTPSRGRTSTFYENFHGVD